MENNEIQFDEIEYRMPARKVQRNLFVIFLIKRGWAKDEKQAIYILFGVIGVCILVAIWFFSGGETTPINSVTTQDVLPR